MKRLYVVYDSRATPDVNDDAVVYVSCDTLSEARTYVKEDFPDGVIYSYEVTEEDELIDERRE